MEFGCTRVLAAAVVCIFVYFISPFVPKADAGILQVLSRHFFGNSRSHSSQTRRVAYGHRSIKKTAHHQFAYKQRNNRIAKVRMTYSTSAVRSICVKASQPTPMLVPSSRNLRRSTAITALPIFHRQFSHKQLIVTSDALARPDPRSLDHRRTVPKAENQLASRLIKHRPRWQEEHSKTANAPVIAGVQPAYTAPFIVSHPNRIPLPPAEKAATYKQEATNNHRYTFHANTRPLLSSAPLLSRTAELEKSHIMPDDNAHATNHDVAFSTRASWYGPGFQGRKTASGQIYNQYGLTAASRTLRLGSKVLVANPSTGKCCTVTINDRGPYVSGRDIDLSRGAAAKIGVTGVSPVVCVAYAEENAPTPSHRHHVQSRPPKMTGTVMHLIANVD